MIDGGRQAALNFEEKGRWLPKGTESSGGIEEKENERRKFKRVGITSEGAK